MGIFEILVILIVAVIFLGPEKLPQAMVDVVKFFKAVKKTLNDAKETFDKELQISEIKKEALEYKSHFESSVDRITKDIQLKEIDEVFKEHKNQEQTAILPKDSKSELVLQDVSTQEKTPKKRGRKPKNTEEHLEKKAPVKSRSTKIEKSEVTKTRSVTPKSAKSAGFKRSLKTPKES